MKTILHAAALLGSLFLANAAQAQTTMKVNVGYTVTAGFAGLFVGKDQGFFSRRGLDVDITPIALNSTIPAALVGGSVQIGGPTPSVLLQAVESGLDLVVIAGCSVNDVKNVTGGIVARTGVDIKTAKDFEGKKVGAPGLGAYMHVLFRKWLEDKGADSKKVNFLEVPFAQTSDILKAGSVDAVLTGDPFLSRIMQAKTGYLVSPFLTEMPDGLFSIYYASTREWADKNPAAIKAFREGLQEANDYIIKEPEKARGIIGKFTKLPPEVVATMTLPKLAVDVPVADVKYWADMLADQTMLRTRPDAAKLVQK